MSGVSKLTADKNQRILLDLVSKPGNDVCADCRARTPRWASHNLGIFICMNCASIHRKIGTHITKVKSVTMDSWSREQVEVMKSIGNVASNAKYNPNEARHPPPANREESERDSELEKYIRWKYEFKRFMSKSPPSSSVKAPPARAQSTPVTTLARQPSPVPRVPTLHQPTSLRRPETRPFSASTVTASAASHPQPSAPPPRTSMPGPSAPTRVSTESTPIPVPSNPVWNDIMSLAAPMPTRTQLHPPQPQYQQTTFAPPNVATNPYGTSPLSNPFPLNPTNLSHGQNPSVSFQTQNAQPSMSNPFRVSQQPAGFSGQSMGTHFQQASPAGALQVQSPFGQPQSSQSPFSHSYTPPSSFPQNMSSQSSLPHSYTPPSSFPQQPQQRFAQAPSPFPQQLAQPVQQQQQGFPNQQGTNPFGAPMQWQQQAGFAGQPQHGQWGGT